MKPPAHILAAIQSSVQLSELYQTVGYKPMLELIKQWGGRRVYVPIKFGSDEHPLIKCIGKEAAEALSWKHGCEHITVPTEMIIRNAKRDFSIVKVRKEKGRTVSAIAKQFKLSERQVRNILEREEHACRDNPVKPTRPNKKTRRERQLAQSGQLELFPKY